MRSRLSTKYVAETFFIIVISFVGLAAVYYGMVSQYTQERQLDQMSGIAEHVCEVVREENAAAPLKDASLVVAQYPLGGGYKGYIGIIGPTRMNYPQLAARLEYFAKGLGALIRDVMTDGKNGENSTDGRDE